MALGAAMPAGFGSSGSLQALDCPVGDLEPACGAATLVVSTACSQGVPNIGTVGPITLKVDGGPLVVCPI